MITGTLQIPEDAISVLLCGMILPEARLRISVYDAVFCPSAYSPFM